MNMQDYNLIQQTQILVLKESVRIAVIQQENKIIVDKRKELRDNRENMINQILESVLKQENVKAELLKITNKHLTEAIA